MAETTLTSPHGALQDVLYRHLLPLLSPRELLRLCTTSRAAHQLCQNQQLWQAIAQRYYPHIQPLPGQSWSAMIADLSEQRVITVDYYYPGSLAVARRRDLLIRKGTPVGAFCEALLNLPYLGAILPPVISVEQVNSLAAQQGIAPKFTYLLPNAPRAATFRYSSWINPSSGIIQSAEVSILGSCAIGVCTSLFVVNPEGFIGVSPAAWTMFRYYPPPTPLARIFLRDWQASLVEQGLPMVPHTLYDILRNIRIKLR